MGHDIHFLERLDRVSLDHQTLALALYRDPVMTRRFVAALAERDGAPGERIAFALEDGGQGPHVIVTRAGRFVTCLARGMVVSEEVSIISRAQLNANREWMARLRALEGDGQRELRAWVDALLDEGRWPSRDQIRALEIFSPLYQEMAWAEFEFNRGAVRECEEELIGAGRATRRRMQRSSAGVLESFVNAMILHRRYMAHMTVLYAMSVREGEPLLRHKRERDCMSVMAYELAELGTPMALLRAAWLLVQREEITLFEVVAEMRGMAKRDLVYMPLLYALMWSGELCAVLSGKRRVLREALLKVKGKMLAPGHPLLPRLISLMERTAWVSELSELPIHERAARLRAHPEAVVPAWAERFYDPVALEERPEAMVQELLAHDAAWIMSDGEAMVLWLYMPALARRSATLLYPREPAAPLVGRALAERGALYAKELVRHAHHGHKQATVQTQTQGRNEPCACGSGKKYKKCCGGET
jgi:hypothetical protein